MFDAFEHVDGGTAIRIEGDPSSERGLEETRRPYSAGPRCWITQNTYQFYIGFLGRHPRGSRRIRAFLASANDRRVHEPVRKWINVINGHREKVRPVIGSLVGVLLRAPSRALIVPFCLLDKMAECG